MYKVDIHLSELFLIGVNDIRAFDKDDRTTIIYYSGIPSTIMKYVHILDLSNKSIRIVIVSKQFKQLKSDFKSYFMFIEAAGGLVVNEKSEILFIYRRGRWGLPKGKLKKEELRKIAAIREIEEETGVKALEIKEKIGKTHLAKQLKNGQWILKSCHWYYMNAKRQPLFPQFEEEIEKAVWMQLQEFKAMKPMIDYSLEYLFNYIPFIPKASFLEFASNNNIIKVNKH